MDRVPVTPSAPAVTAFGALTASTVILAVGNRRVGLMIYNDMDVNLYVLLGTGTVSLTSYHFKLTPGQLYETPGLPAATYKGVVTAIQSGGTSGRILVSEFTD